ncbi:uncharacterized protein BYT42DRAFT_547595 [Radiomyces spectabilis]|uniref:uncharacterized protein n=1 Tax=Radiomyces spectabilis TaxID=64574 RepID=UPI00221F67B1|nr:uncharacterized protein BYT42DRAFT_547595 [Radiomyces spectabilis]KAI8374573.1 hypothetical protein BYT42DRAFT_547595 [Radiomyces spectabilis]
MKLYPIVAGLSLAASWMSVHATPDAGISLTAPVQGTVWYSGRPQLVQWRVTNGNVDTIETVELRNGMSTNLDFVIQLNISNIPVNDGQFIWEIPNNTVTDPMCELKQAKHNVLLLKSNLGTTYSAYFTILGVAPDTTNTATESPVKSPASNASQWDDLQKTGHAAAASGTATKGSVAPSGASSSSSSSSSSATHNILAVIVTTAGAVAAVTLLL